VINLLVNSIGFESWVNPTQGLVFGGVAIAKEVWDFRRMPVNVWTLICGVRETIIACLSDCCGERDDVINPVRTGKQVENHVPGPDGFSCEKKGPDQVRASPTGRSADCPGRSGIVLD
jgi:hypothetical protein